MAGTTATKEKGKLRPGSIGQPHLSGFCADWSPVESRKHCKGAVSNEDGTTWLCSAPWHEAEAKCHRCGFDHGDPASPDFDPTRRQCLDRSDCEAERARRTAEKMATDPLMRLIVEIRDEAARERADRNAEKARRRAEEAARAAGTGNGSEAAGDTSETLGRVRPVRAPRSPQRCHCGCGGMTKGGMFVAGHDMKLKGALYRLARAADGPWEKLDSETRGAIGEIYARGWNPKGINPQLWAQVEGLVDREATVRARANGRYEK